MHIFHVTLFFSLSGCAVFNLPLWQRGPGGFAEVPPAKGLSLESISPVIFVVKLPFLMAKSAF